MKKLGRSARILDASLLCQTAVELAPLLLGKLLLVIEDNGSICGGRIVETEAYHQSEPASHSYIGETKRNHSMFRPGGRAYIYRSYGIHWCFNVVSGLEGSGEAVLVRAVEPIWGLDTMRARRGLHHSPRNLTNGPGKLCQAMRITGKMNGADLRKGPILLLDDGVSPESKILSCKRIGISKATELPWRFRTCSKTP